MGGRLIKQIASLHAIHWLIIIASLCLTIFAWNIAKKQTDEKLNLRFDYQSDQLLELVTDRMSRYEDALRAGVAAISIQNGEMDSAKWYKFYSNLRIDESYPGINGIGVIYHVDQESIDSFIDEQRILRPGFNVHPAHDRDEYWPITYVEPVAPNAQAVGLDMAFEDNRYSAAIKARNQNTTQITAPITLVQDDGHTPGFLQFVPFYSSNAIGTEENRKQYFVGHVYAPFIMNKLIEGTLSQTNRELVFSLYDGEHILYDELTTENVHYDSNPLFTNTLTVDMYGRPWTFTIQTSSAFRENANVHQPHYILVGGLLVDSALLLLFLALSRSRKRAIERSNDTTKKLKVSESYFRSIVESAPCGILIANRENTIECVNPQAMELLGYQESEILGETIDVLIPNNIREKHSSLQQTFWNQAGQRRMGAGRNVKCLTKSGREFPAEIGLSPLTEDDGDKVIITLIDMSTHVAINNALEQSNSDLNDIVYIASHDLKSPLRGIIQLTNWISEDLESLATTETQEHLAMLKSRASRLSNLLDDLLGYFRADKLDGVCRQVDTAKMLERIADMQCPEGRMELKYTDELPTFYTMSVPLEVIFRNLIGNAIKHHDRSTGVIRIECSEVDERYVFAVSDDGPGIDPVHQEKIFELFTTLKSRDAVEGSGMGLSIIRKILRHYDCDIRVETDGSRGTTFVFDWPKAISSTEQHSQAA